MGNSRFCKIYIWAGYFEAKHKNITADFSRLDIGWDWEIIFIPKNDKSNKVIWGVRGEIYGFLFLFWG